MILSRACTCSSHDLQYVGECSRIKPSWRKEIFSVCCVWSTCGVQRLDSGGQVCWPSTFTLWASSLALLIFSFFVGGGRHRWGQACCPGTPQVSQIDLKYAVILLPQSLKWRHYEPIHQTEKTFHLNLEDKIVCVCVCSWVVYMYA